MRDKVEPHGEGKEEKSGVSCENLPEASKGAHAAAPFGAGGSGVIVGNTERFEQNTVPGEVGGEGELSVIDQGVWRNRPGERATQGINATGGIEQGEV